MILPPELSQSLAALQYSTLNYLPTMYPIPEAVLKDNVPGKIYDISGDYSFMRTGGFVLTPLAALLLLTVIMKILTIPEINRFKNFRVWCHEQFDEKFKLSFFVEFASIFYLNTVFFSFLQMKDYTPFDAFYLAGIIISDLLLLVLVSVLGFIAFKVIRFYLDN